MTLTISTENLYLSIIFVLMIVQVFQWRAIFKLKDQLKLVWAQMYLLMTAIEKQSKDAKEKS